jgi:hypothetical protein
MMRISPPYGKGPGYDVPDAELDIAKHLSLLVGADAARALPNGDHAQVAYITSLKLLNKVLHGFCCSAIALCLLAKRLSPADEKVVHTWMENNIVKKSTPLDKILRVTATLLSNPALHRLYLQHLNFDLSAFCDLPNDSLRNGRHLLALLTQLLAHGDTHVTKEAVETLSDQISERNGVVITSIHGWKHEAHVRSYLVRMKGQKKRQWKEHNLLVRTEESRGKVNEYLQELASRRITAIKLRDFVENKTEEYEVNWPKEEGPPLMFREDIIDMNIPPWLAMMERCEIGVHDFHVYSGEVHLLIWDPQLERRKWCQRSEITTDPVVIQHTQALNESLIAAIQDINEGDVFRVVWQGNWPSSRTMTRDDIIAMNVVAWTAALPSLLYLFNEANPLFPPLAPDPSLLSPCSFQSYSDQDTVMIDNSLQLVDGLERRPQSQAAVYASPSLVFTPEPYLHGSLRDYNPASVLDALEPARLHHELGESSDHHYHGSPRNYNPVSLTPEPDYHSVSFSPSLHIDMPSNGDHLPLSAISLPSLSFPTSLLSPSQSATGADETEEVMRAMDELLLQEEKRQEKWDLKSCLKELVALDLPSDTESLPDMTAYGAAIEKIMGSDGMPKMAAQWEKIFQLLEKPSFSNGPGLGKL